MPKSGYKVVTITEDVYQQVIADLAKANDEAGFKKFRNISHFVEEAIMNYAMGVIKDQGESPDAIIAKVVEVMWNRPALLKKLFERLVAMSVEDTARFLREVLTDEELEHMKAVCDKMRTRGNRKGVKEGDGEGKAHMLVDIGGKLLYLNQMAKRFMPNRRVGDSILDGTVLTAESQQQATTVLKKVLTSKDETVDSFTLTYVDGQVVQFTGEAKLVPDGDGEKVFDITFTGRVVRPVATG